MTKNPIINASAGSLYIIFVACLMFFGMEHSKPDNTIFVPIAVLSLFSLSAAVMGYLFISKPFQLYLDGKKKEASTLFLQTVLVFGLVTAGIFTLLISGAFR